ncbi:MAG: Ca2+/Na+ antiporter [Motiliproteus sp.]|jgi:Ca2+/Na+ antiporter
MKLGKVASSFINRCGSLALREVMWDKIVNKPAWVGSVYILAIPVFGLIYYFNPIFWNMQLTLVQSIYFSIVTITTLGYGDITPQTDLARSLTALESIFGIILIGFFLNAVARASDIRREERQKEALKGSLRAMLVPYLASCSLIAYQHSVKVAETTEIFNESIENIHNKLLKATINDDADSVKELVEYVRFHKSSLVSSLVIAAKIGPDMVKAWNSLLTQINIIDSIDSNYGPHISNSITTLKVLD